MNNHPVKLSGSDPTVARSKVAIAVLAGVLCTLAAGHIAATATVGTAFQEQR